ncbi:hypothetical protein FACS1894109_16930 [Spirochaetia bacterium]|nr:hypothetical protein FACS1894109_16930 [Spirochaetia bacterium]
MDFEFAALLSTMAEEQGAGIFDSPYLRTALDEYTRGEFQKESRLLLLCVETGCHRQLRDTSEPLDTARTLERELRESLFIEATAAAAIVKALTFALRPELRARNEQNTKPVESQNFSPRKPIAHPERAFIKIEGGIFLMGSGSTPVFIKPVRVSSFFMGKYAVTQAEYEDIMGENPSYHLGPELPVEGVMWYKAVEFCNFRSEREGLAPVYEIDKSYLGPPSRYRYDKYAWRVRWNREAGGNSNTAGYRLPTSAEWEYACRAGTLTDYYTGDTITEKDACINSLKPMPVGSFPPNPWGLCDMHGNVSEWCWDYRWERQSRETEEQEAVDPTGPDEGFCRVYRGGSFCSIPDRYDDLHSMAARDQMPYPWFVPYIGPIGIRLVRGGDYA